jgi:hypothetical protein
MAPHIVDDISLLFITNYCLPALNPMSAINTVNDFHHVFISMESINLILSIKTHATKMQPASFPKRIYIFNF